MKIHINFWPANPNPSALDVANQLRVLADKIERQNVSPEVGHKVDMIDKELGLNIGTYSVESSYVSQDETLMTAGQLAAKYSRTREHPDYSRESWGALINQKRCILSYWDWVVECLDPDE